MRFTLNGKRRTITTHPMKRLLDVLREDCGLTGTKEGCGEGECGACTVLLDGAPVNSCLLPVAQVGGCRVQTIEGLGGRHPLQKTFVEFGGAQCGICTPGMIMAAAALGPKPSPRDMKVGLAGNLCRCTGYSAIYRSIAKTAVSRAGHRRASSHDQRSATLKDTREHHGASASRRGGGAPRPGRAGVGPREH
jgi:carbon-monoxide dehydrogenase small subunit/xanthine dehydrogenase small subunit